MRLFLLIIITMLPEAGRAQLFGGNRFEAGSYVLNDSRTVRQQGQLRLQNGTKLMVKAAGGKTIKLTPEQVSSFRINTRKYVTVGNFHVRGGINADIDKGFAEQLDSGRVVLLNYTFPGGSAPVMGADGMRYGGESYERNAYLLNWPGESEVTAVQGSFYTGGGKQFREAVRPFLFSRPDLEKLLDDKLITSYDLPKVIHALNNNLPYRAPAVAPPSN